jgi:adenosylcobinamide-phosphate synthase
MIIELYANAIYMLLTIMIFSLAFDLIVGEFPARIHPVVLVGGIISFFKDRLVKYNSRTAGLFLTICVIAFGSLIMLVPLLIFKMFIFNDIMEYVFKLVALLLLSSCFSVKLLLSSAREVEDDLKKGNLKVARERVSYLVSRKTNELSKEHVISATIETLTENIPDSYVSTMFYYVLFGVIAYFIGFNDFNAVIIAVVQESNQELYIRILLWLNIEKLLNLQRQIPDLFLIIATAPMQKLFYDCNLLLRQLLGLWIDRFVIT